MKQPIQVVILPTEDKSFIYKLFGNQLPTVYLSKENIVGVDFRLNQHIHITVSQDVEPIKEGDWCYHLGLNRIEQWNDNKELDISLRRKIIATTDPKLIIKYKQKNLLINKEIDNSKLYSTKPIPQVSQSFLKEFVANPDGEYEVEYEDNMLDDQNPDYIITLKLNQDNTVNININISDYNKEIDEPADDILDDAEIDEVMTIYGLSFTKSDESSYGFIGGLFSIDGSNAVAIFNACFYVRDSQFPLNTKTLLLIKSLQYWNKTQ